MRIVLLGAPGSGKSVIAQKIASKYGFSVVSVEEVAEELSIMAKEEDEMGRLARESIGAGRVSDDVCNVVVKRVLGREQLVQGFVLVGYPKDAAQAEFIETSMNQMRRPLDMVLMIDIDRDELMERRVGRINCDSCGEQYNLYVNPPMVEGICDVCGSRVNRRPRGYEENISNQLREYYVVVEQILDYFRSKDKLHMVNGNGTEEALWADVQQVIDTTPPAKIAPIVKQEEEVAAKAKKAVAKKKTSAKKKTPAAKKASGKASAKPKAASRKKTAAKSTGKKTAGRKKVAAKKTSAKKAAAKKTVTKKTATKKKSVANKAPGKKKTVKKAVASASGTKTSVSKKTPAKKVTKKKAAKIKVAKKKVTKKKVTKKKVVKKPTAKKVVKKTPVRKKAASKKKSAAKN